MEIMLKMKRNKKKRRRMKLKNIVKLWNRYKNLPIWNSMWRMWDHRLDIFSNNQGIFLRNQGMLLSNLTPRCNSKACWREKNKQYFQIHPWLKLNQPSMIRILSYHHLQWKTHRRLIKTTSTWINYKLLVFKKIVLKK